MKIEGVVVDASPLIILSRSRLADLLPKLFPEVLIPGAVWDEVAAGGTTDEGARPLSAPWARRVNVSEVLPALLPWNLGAGESEVLTLAHSLARHRARVDDAAARSCARTLGIPILGTGGVLILAKRRGLIPSVSVALQALRDAGLWLSQDVDKLLRWKAGE